MAGAALTVASAVNAAMAAAWDAEEAFVGDGGNGKIQPHEATRRRCEATLVRRGFSRRLAARTSWFAPLEPVESAPGGEDGAGEKRTEIDDRWQRFSR